ncbi:hypothetical protein B0A55_05900 [Friedmanniomyces simplex]|uniref:RNase H type-1 domain-containing protein n=1 Tax=Friedmanniomyces simplex TaxID=329884 RepID=A0A4U0XIL4_9PEZI|nr:hypothetical protein B0A55_05900 [Friedmanniomyces simplex]
MEKTATTVVTGQNSAVTTAIATAASQYPTLCAHERQGLTPLQDQSHDATNQRVELEARDAQSNDFSFIHCGHGGECACIGVKERRGAIANADQGHHEEGASDEAPRVAPAIRWESTPCGHIDRAYWPPSLYGQHHSHRIWEVAVNDKRGDTFIFAHWVRFERRSSAFTGIGVYFGSDSPFNISELASRSLDGPDSTTAELSAGLRALQIIIDLKKAGRIPLVKEVILKTDSASMHNAMTNKIFAWRRDGFIKGGRGMKYRDLFWSLEEAIVELYNTHHTAVLFFWTPRKFNVDADQLATAALRREDSCRLVELANMQALRHMKRKRDALQDTELVDPKRLCGQKPPAPWLRRNSVVPSVPSVNAVGGSESSVELRRLSRIAAQITPNPLDPLMAKLGHSARGKLPSPPQLPHLPPPAKAFQPSDIYGDDPATHPGFRNALNPWNQQQRQPER